MKRKNLLLDKLNLEKLKWLSTLLLGLLTFTSLSFGQNCPSVNVPYIAPLGTATTPSLPDCMTSELISGAGWKTQNNPTGSSFGFVGNNDIYLASTASGFGQTVNFWTYTPAIHLDAGVDYNLHFKYIMQNYNNSNPCKLIVAMGSSDNHSAMNDTLVNLQAITVSISHNESPMDTVVTFTVPTSGDYYIGFNNHTSVTGFGSSILFLGNIDITSISSCTTPAELTVTDVNTNTAKANWNAITPTPSAGYEYYVSTSSTTPTPTVTPTGQTMDTFVTLQNLDANSSYNIWVRGVCGPGEASNWSQPNVFKTLCTPTSIPYAMTVDSPTVPQIPECLRTVKVNNAGSNWKSMTGMPNFFSCPRVPAPLGQMDSWLFSRGIMLNAGGSYKIDLSYSTSQFDVEKMSVSIGSLPVVDSMNTILLADENIINPIANQITFTVPETGVYYIGFRGYSDQNKGDIWLWDVSVDTLVGVCLPPANLHVNSVDPTNNALVLSWNHALTPINGGYQYFYSTDPNGLLNNPQPSGTTSDTSIEINNLTTGSRYYFWVRSICGAGDTSDWSNPSVNYMMPCAPTSVPYVAPIAGTNLGSLPSCMTTQLINANGTDWYTEFNSSNSHGLTNNYLQCDPISLNSNGDVDSWVFTNGIQMTAGGEYQITFKYSSVNGGFHERLMVYFGDLNSSDRMDQLLFDTTTIINALPAPEQVLTVTAPSSGVYYFGFRAHSLPGTNHAGIIVADVSVDTIQTCFAPEFLNHRYPTETSVQLSWTAAQPTPGNGYEYYFNTTNIPPTPNTTPSGTTTNTFVNLTGLTGGTQYYFWVRSACSPNETSSWSNRGDFRTLCPPQDLDYFAMISVNPPALPPCMTREAIDPRVQSWASQAGPVNGFPDVSLISNSNNQDGPVMNNWVFTKGLNLHADSIYRLVYRLVTTGAGSYSHNFRVGIGKDMPTADSVYATIIDKPNITGASISDDTLTFTVPENGVYYLGFQDYSDTNQWWMYLGNISVSYVTTCLPVTNLTATNIDPTNATLTWDGTSPLYDVEYGPAGFVPGTGTEDVTNNTFYHIGGLTPNTTYDYYVRSICVPGFDSADWSLVHQFTTPCVNAPNAALGNDTLLCNGASITIPSGNTDPNNTTVWSDGSTGNSLTTSTAGTYYVTVTNPDGCSISDTIEIQTSNQPIITSIQNSNLGGGTFQFQAIGGSSTDSYLWSFGDGTTSTDETPEHTYTNVGNYDVSVIVSNPCGSDTFTTNINYQTTGIGDVSVDANKISVFPNPAKDLVTIANGTDYSITHVMVYNLLGQKIETRIEKANNQIALQVGSLNSGIYSIEIFLSNGNRIIKKLEILR